MSNLQILHISDFPQVYQKKDWSFSYLLFTTWVGHTYLKNLQTMPKTRPHQESFEKKTCVGNNVLSDHTVLGGTRPKPGHFFSERPWVFPWIICTTSQCSRMSKNDLKTFLLRKYASMGIKGYIQWTPAIPAALGDTHSGLISEVATFQSNLTNQATVDHQWNWLHQRGTKMYMYVRESIFTIIISSATLDNSDHNYLIIKLLWVLIKLL